MTTDNCCATIALFAYNDLERGRRRLERDVVPSLVHHANWRFEIIVVDNSERRLDALADAVARLPWRSRYLWHDGLNLRYGPSMNLVANLAEYPFLVYACMNHGRMLDPSWIEDLVRPMWQDERVALSGHLFPSAPPTVLGFPDNGQLRFHVQGGILAARTDVIRRYPYQEAEWAHGGSDVWQSYRLMDEGFSLCDVPTIYSTAWPGERPGGPWKYLHEYVDDP